MSTPTQYDYLIYIGRMQPPTKAHVSTVKRALDMASNVIVLFGSSFQPRTIKNPWSWIERATMLTNQLPAKDTSRLICKPIRDFRYNDAEWVQQVQKIVKIITLGKVSRNLRIGVIGHKKDSSSFYLDMFPQWKFVPVEQIDDVNATQVRDEYFSGQLDKWHDKDLISPELKQYLKDWSKCDQYTNLCDEYRHIQEYKKSWEPAPYDPFFVTVDAVVIQSGHILMIQRRSAPGKGLWALPGGFVKPGEYLTVAALRELREETKLKVPTAVMAGSMKGSHVFDNPDRSLRGRTITHAYAFYLPAGELSKVKGSDDAAKAKWIPINDVLDMEEHIFEDHLSIIDWALNLIG